MPQDNQGKVSQDSHFFISVPTIGVIALPTSLGLDRAAAVAKHVYDGTTSGLAAVTHVYDLQRGAVPVAKSENANASVEADSDGRYADLASRVGAGYDAAKDVLSGNTGTPKFIEDLSRIAAKK